MFMALWLSTADAAARPESREQRLFVHWYAKEKGKKKDYRSW